MAVIEVFADVRCPFTHVSLRRLVEQREERDTRPVLRVRAWPLELVNGEPMDVDLVDEEVGALREQVAPELFAGFSPAAFSSTSLPALALTAMAYDRDLESGERVALALRWAMFEEGRDIADDDVLGDIASSAGISWEDGGVGQRVLDEWREGEGRGVLGSPHYFVGGEGWFAPMLDISRDDAGFHVTENQSARDLLLERASLM